ncbi:MAG: poly(3-hydroxybutyrate) depolymerase, partial [Saprospiraceae bacterium]
MIRSLCILFCLIYCGISGAQSDSMTIEGYTRNFEFIKPVDLKPGASLVFVLHGSGGNGKGQMTSTKQFISQVSNENVMLVYPTGYKNYWNECRKEASSDANKLDINEQAFFKSMIDYFTKNFKINTHHVFAVGTSGGGHMCYKLAMTMPGSIRAITAIIANLPDTNNLDCADATKALPVMIVNGTADPTNPYDGGYMGSPTFKMGNVRSTERSFAYWS